MYYLLNNTLKTAIKKSIRNSLNNNFSIDLVHTSSLRKIIRLNDKYENKLIDETISKINLYYKLKENPKIETYGNTTWKVAPTHEKNEVENAISIISDLINFGIIKNPLKYKNLLKYAEFDTTKYLAFVLDMKNFNYNKFEVSYIHYLTPKKIRELKNIIQSNKTIKKIVKEKILNKININNRFNDTYMINKIFYILFNEQYFK